MSKDPKYKWFPIIFLLVVAFAYFMSGVVLHLIFSCSVANWV